MAAESENTLLKQIRSARDIGVLSGIAIGVSVTVGVGVYDLLGLLETNYGARSLAKPYLILILVALPFILTYAERSRIFPKGDGVYTLVYRGRWLWPTFFTAWGLLGGYIALLALLGWGAGQHILLALRLFGVNAPHEALSLFAIILVAAGNFLGFRRNWRRRSWIAGIATLLLVVLTMRGFLIKPTTAAPPSFYIPPLTPSLIVVGKLSAILWGIPILLSVRAQIGRRKQSMRLILLIVVGVGGLIGAMASWALMKYNGINYNSYAPLLIFTQEDSITSSPLLQALYIVLGFLINFLAIDRVLIDVLHLNDQMTNDGFLPQTLERFRNKRGVHGWSLLAVLTTVGALLYITKPIALVDVTAGLFFLVTILIHASDLFEQGPNFFARRAKLPFHPLFPAITIATSVLMLLGSPWRHLLIPLLWIGVGGLLYQVYTRKQGHAKRRQETILDEEPIDSDLDSSRKAVLVAVTDMHAAPSLVRAGLQLAQSQQMALFVLRVLLVPEQTSAALKQRLAQKELKSLDALIHESVSGNRPEDLPVRSLVRLGVDIADSILDTVENESVDLLLVNWAGPLGEEAAVANPVINRLMRGADCNVAVLRGELPAEPREIVIGVEGGPHAQYAVRLANTLLPQGGGYRLRVVTILEPGTDQAAKSEAMKILDDALAGLESTDAVERAQIVASTPEAGLLQEASQADLLMLGSYRNNFFHRSEFRGMSLQVATQTTIPTLIVRAQEKARYPFLASAWEFISDPLPSLTSERRATVATDMRAAAKPSVDFFVLIILSSVIASLGLLQNSAAVIIGAMLVAPLMSPILAIGMGMAIGEPKTLGKGAEATAKGVALAVFVGALVAMISPLQTATNEIMARTAPNLLDLMVALASGAAAGYAVSRKEVAAALPGVAIAAALVPPLCVVGYGLGTSQLSIATGASLLFITNLIAIFLSAALVFVALGFRARKQEQSEIIRGIRLTVVSMLLITVVLGLTTFSTVRDLNRQVAVEKVFNRPPVSTKATVTDLSITQTSRRSYTIDAIFLLLNDEGLTPRETEELEADLEEAVGGPVQLNATLIPSTKSSSEGASLRRSAELEFIKQVEEQGGRVLKTRIKGGTYRLTIEATVLDEMPRTLSNGGLVKIQKTLEETLDTPVVLQVDVLAGQYVEVEATPTPTSTIAPTPTSAITPTP
jgi:uncharacterized hydrophobic protein (TIGR00271 family)